MTVIALLFVVGVPLLMCLLAWGLCRAAAKPDPQRDWDSELAEYIAAAKARGEL